MEMVLNSKEHELHKDDSFDYDQIGSKKSFSNEQESGSKPSSPHEATGDFIFMNNIKQDKIESTRTEMGKMREENERLKEALEKIRKDYQSLQMQLDIVHQEQSNNSTETSAGSLDDQEQSSDEQELVSLTLGTSLKKLKKEAGPDQASIKAEDELGGKLTIHDLKIGFEKINEDQLEQKNHSPKKIIEGSKNEKIEDSWPLNKVVKTLRNVGEELNVQEQSPLKKARVSVRARCEAPTMNDGCQWRKYGQKIAKGNPCPRAYYRCTVAPGCPVRKQVQRCADDMSILVTTYEGNHNHPLPISATTMASTTSAAASILMSGSSTSGQTIVNPSLATSTAFSGIHNLNFSVPNSSRTSPFYLSNQSISPSPSCPTITLDLTSNPSTSSQFNKYSASFPSSTSLNFNYNGNSQFSYSKGQNGSFTVGAVQPQDQFYSSYLQKNPSSNPTQAALTSDTIAAATKVLTSDPNFKSALAAAITSMVGSGRRETQSGLNMKWGEQFQPQPSFAASHVINSCSPSFLNRSSSSTTNSQAGTFTFLPPALQLASSTNDVSASPMNITEHTS